MEFLQPDDWQEALEAKAAHPDALPLWGGTDVMVDLNFGRERPEAILDLTRVRDLAAWAPGNGTLRVGAGVTYTRASQPMMPPSSLGKELRCSKKIGIDVAEAMRRSCRSFAPPTWLPNRGSLARLPLPWCATTGTQATPKEQVEVIEMA